MAMTIGISGASGQLGRRVADLVLETVDPSAVVLVSRSPAALDAYAQRGASVRYGNFDEPGSLRDAYRGIDRLLLISGSDVGRRLPQHTAAIEAAKETGVCHVVYTSIVNPTEANPAGVTPEHRGTEEALRASGLGWTFLRNGIYADLTAHGLEQSIAAGRHAFNSGDGGISYVTRDDCAAAAAAVLAGEGHEGKAYDITGPEALSGHDLARLASEVSGKEVLPVALADEDFVRMLVEQGVPEPVARFRASFGRAAREGYLAVVSGDFERLTGRPPAAFRTLL